MRRTKVPAIARKGDIPLEFTVQKLERPDGGTALVSSLQRGLLKQTFVSLTDRNGRPVKVHPHPAKVKLERLASELRDSIKESGYPADERPVWVSVAGGEWEPDDDLENDFGGQPFELASWYKRLVSITEPLSNSRIAGTLLYAVTELQRRNHPDHILEEFAHVLSAYRAFIVAGEANRLAMRGKRTEANLARGPIERNRRSNKTLSVVCSHAEQYWQKRPLMRGIMAITAEEISTEVNRELRSLGRTEIRPKTIADYISKGICGGHFDTR